MPPGQSALKNRFSSLLPVQNPRPVRFLWAKTEHQFGLRLLEPNPVRFPHTKTEPGSVPPHQNRTQFGSPTPELKTGSVLSTQTENRTAVRTGN